MGFGFRTFLFCGALIGAASLGNSVIGTSAFAAEYKWGAISIDTALGKSPAYGIGGGDTKEEAVENAQKFCKEAGGSKCQVATTYEKCGAVATNKTSGFWGIGATEKEASDRALKACEKGDCQVQVADCN